MLTYFYNEFRPLYCMHCINRGVNNSWLTQFCLLRVCGTLGHCFSLTHSINTEGDLQIYCRVVFLKTRHRAQTHVISCTLIHCALSVAVNWTQTEEQFGGWFCWPVLVMVTLLRDTTFVAATLGLPTILGVGWSCSSQLSRWNSSPEGAWSLGGYI